MPTLNSWVVAGALAVSVATGVAGYRHGKHVAEADAALAADSVRVAYERAQQKAAVALEARLSAGAKVKESVARETQKIITRAVYRNVCLDADGLRQLERARVGGEGDASQPAGEMSGTP